MKMRQVLTGSLVALLFVVTAAFATPDRRAPSLQGELVASLREVCTAKCEECQNGAGHKVNEAEQGGTHGRGNHDCVIDSLSCAYHTCAAAALNPQVDVMRAVAQNDVEALRQAFSDKNFRYVPERGVVQLLADCGSVIAQVPVSAVTAGELALE